MEASFHFSFEIYATKKVVTKFRRTEQSDPESSYPQHASSAASRCHVSQDSEYTHDNSNRNAVDRLWIEHIASLPGTTFEKVVNVFRNRGLWSVDRYVFTHDDFAPSIVTDPPETIQAEKPAADGIENFSPSSVYEAKPRIPRQIPDRNGYIPVNNISPLTLHTGEGPRPKSRRKHTASGAGLTRTVHQESLNRSNIAGFSGAKPKTKTLYAERKAVTQRIKSHYAEENCCLLCGETYDGVWMQRERCKN
jgi:hypothetical protein